MTTSSTRQTAREQRLYVPGGLGAGMDVTLSPEQAHYLRNVMRLKPGAALRLFNGRDGEWRGEVSELGKKSATVACRACTREQTGGTDLHLLFAPLKHARLDYMVQKATEMGASVLQPALTAFTVPQRVNLERMRANAAEAAEQCNMLSVPDVREPAKLSDLLERWPDERALIFCDEAAEQTSPLDALWLLAGRPLGLFIGPEGGFSEDECGLLRAAPFVTAISLGPRIMRADTAAVAALAVVQAAIGDWR